MILEHFSPARQRSFVDLQPDVDVLMLAPLSLPQKSLPPRLAAGDHLDAEEFCRRWDQTPELKHAELIGGRVFMNPPISAGSHGLPHGDMIVLLGNYAAATPGTQMIVDASVHLSPVDLPQPDVLLRIEEAYGGASRLHDEELYGPPELVVEIAASSAAYDLFEKKQTYLKHSIQEYLVWSVYEQSFSWLSRETDEYHPLDFGRSGILKSRVFPGLWLDRSALLDHNLAKAIRTLGKGIDSPEHQQFVKALKLKWRSLRRGRK